MNFVKILKILIYPALLLFLAACGPGKLDNSLANQLLLAGLLWPSCKPSTAPPVYFTTAQSASVVIGQTGFTTQTSGLSSSTLNAPMGNPAVADGHLYLSDYNNGRVLGYNSIPTSNGVAADFVLGASDFTTAGTINQATQPTLVRDQLFVTDYVAQRFDVFSPVPVATTSSPTYTITGASETNLGFFDVETVAYACGKMALTDADHNRVLIWNNAPTSDGQQPDLVLGQSDFATNNIASTPDASTMCYPSGIWTDGIRLVVADNCNHRVLIWNSWPAANGQPADLVLGQADFSGGLNNAGVSVNASTMYSPANGVYASGNQIFIADTNNNRVLIWNSWPTQNGQPADVALGQDTLTSGSQNKGTPTSPVDSSLYAPNGVFLTDTTLIVTDRSNNRYMLFNGTH